MIDATSQAEHEGMQKQLDLCVRLIATQISAVVLDDGGHTVIVQFGLNPSWIGQELSQTRGTVPA